MTDPADLVPTPETQNLKVRLKNAEEKIRSLEAEIEIIAQALFNVSDELLAENHVEILPEGTKLRGYEF